MKEEGRERERERKEGQNINHNDIIIIHVLNKTTTIFQLLRI